MNQTRPNRPSATSPPGGPVVLFDGQCNLCCSSVQFILRRDPAMKFRFAALGSEAAERMLAGRGAPDPLPDSLVLVDRDGVHVRSDAALRIARDLRFPWNLLGAAAILPRRWRDLAYDWVARKRYRWFGRRDACMIPSPELGGRFLR